MENAQLERPQDILKNIDVINRTLLEEHPFSSLSSPTKIEKIIPQYLAMSLAFPYIQAGSQSEIILDTIRQNKNLEKDFEITSVVGNFLSWDETGGAYILETMGKSSLSKILETHKWFHANILRSDIKKIFNKELKEDFNESTKTYLEDLYQRLSCSCKIRRCATMVAFETHAQAMIESLWASLTEQFSIDPNDLIYFKIHVGGDDPAEIYHAEMTRSMIERLISPDESEVFEYEYRDALERNIDWCKSLS